ncbi:MAG: hypothetical protein BGO29_04620 [Bacteroidales bacterium 36-12]|nr:MAG: hypothetical protein BGO29_04620 [Bacteroidales bacterium 36-12]
MKVIQIIFISFLLLSCKPAEKISTVENTQHVVSASIREENNNVLEIIQNLVKESVISVDNISSIQIIEYDTTKEINTLTGKLPESKIIIINKSNKTLLKDVASDNVFLKNENSEVFSSDAKTESFKQVIEEKISYIEKPFKWYDKVFIFMGKLYLIIILITLIYIIYRLLPKTINFTKVRRYMKK